MRLISLVFVVAFCSLGFSSFAQAVPDAAAQTMQGAYADFPQLPPSRACAPEDVSGVWQLFKLFELPAGVETQGFTVNPKQYLAFGEYNQFADVRGIKDQKPDQVNAQIGKEMLQYIVTSQGMMYSYKNNVYDTTSVCFMVVSPLGEFKPGQMLLMPPEDKHKGRLVKIYTPMLKPTLPPATDGK